MVPLERERGGRWGAAGDERKGKIQCLERKIADGGQVSG